MTAYVYVKEELKIVDEDLLNAIMYHPTGRKNMTILEQIIFVADYVEDTRKYESCIKARNVAYDSLIDAVILKNNLFKSKEITEGSIVTAIIIIAIIPHEFLISEILEVIVLKASFTVEPIIGIKLLIANFAVLIETLSVDCERILLQDKEEKLG